MALFILFTSFLFSSCETKKWDKDTVVNDCLREFYKKNEVEPLFSGMEIPLLCECVSGKLLVKYSSFKESDKDPNGAQQIGMDCAKEVLRKR